MADVIISESKLEEMIFKHITGENKSESIEEFFPSSFCLFAKRQLNLSPFGIADIVVFYQPDYDGSIDAEIIELKKGIIDRSTFFQATRYKAALKAYANMNNIELRNIDITLLGSEISFDDSLEFLPLSFSFINIYTYDIDINTGLTLENQSNCDYKKEYYQEKKLKDIFTCIDYASEDQSCLYYINELGRHKI